ncbi:hypothetical protein Hanom_Chr14g01255571 [Helianthus anomalus]
MMMPFCLVLDSLIAPVCSHPSLNTIFEPVLKWIVVHIDGVSVRNIILEEKRRG